MTSEPTAPTRPYAGTAGWWVAGVGAIGVAVAFLAGAGPAGLAPAATGVLVGVIVALRQPRRPGRSAPLAPPIDRPLALQRCDDDPLLLARLLAGIAEEGEEQLAAIKDGLDRGDAPRVRLAAHRLKGSLQCVAAGPAEAAALAIEVAARDGDLGRAARGCDRLRDELARLTRELPLIP